MASGCGECRDGVDLAVPFSMAFQPIVDVSSQTIFAYEALVRGPQGEGALSVLQNIDDTSRYAFDQQCRVKAIELANSLGIARSGALLSINFLPKAVYEPKACIRLTLETANRVSFPLNKLMFEFTENQVLDTKHVNNIIAQYRSMGFKVALDDFGAGYAGLELLTRIEPDVVKLDMELIRNLDAVPRKRTIVKHTLAMLNDLGILAICEGVETTDELSVLLDLGVCHVQGYLFARPAFEALPEVENMHSWKRPFLG